MIRKASAALALLALAAPTLALAQTLPGPYFIDTAHVERVDCGRMVGSGVRIDGNTVITAYHVISRVEACAIDGAQAKTVHIAGGLDFAALETIEAGESRAIYSCDGFIAGRVYFAIGFADARESAVISRVRATGDKTASKGRFPNMAILRGDATIPGMSGGPVIDEDGFVVGIVNAGDGRSRLLSRPLSDTYICEGKA